ncbi:MAG: hypothetical protein K2J67_02310, partial [Lachnospiraceae bacterium]|nr:hypothetical protein [Lachnospiraceae bacterium]
NKCIKYNYDKKKCEEVMDSYLKGWKENKREYTVCTALNEQKIWVYSYHESCFYILDMENNSVKKKEIVMPYLKWLKTNSPFLQLISESEKKRILGDIDYLLYQLSNVKDEPKSNDNTNINIGGRIYKELSKY